jgi:hypothetical protein
MVLLKRSLTEECATVVTAAFAVYAILLNYRNIFLKEADRSDYV